MRACWCTSIALAAVLAGCVIAQPSVSAPPDSAPPVAASPTTSPTLLAPSAAPVPRPTRIQSAAPTDLPTTIAAQAPIAAPTRVPLATPALPLTQALQAYAGDALLYTRPDRFLMLTDSQHQQPLWLTADICNLENDSTEQRGQWSVDGRYLAITCNQEQNSDGISTALLDTVTGTVQRLPFSESVLWSPVSPRALLQGSNGEGIDWYVVDAQTQTIAKLITLNDQNSSAAWSPDGMQIALSGRRAGHANTITLINANGSHIRQVFVEARADSTGFFGPISWSPDGAFLLLNRQLNPSPQTYTYQALRFDIPSKRSQILRDELHAPLEFYWSSDGKWVVMGQSGQPGSHLGRWTLYRSDGTLVHTISTDAQRDDIAIRWRPNSQQLVILAVRLNVGVEVLTRDLEAHETVIARYPNNGPGFPALAISPNGTLIAINLSEQGIAILNLAGQEQALFPGRIYGWRPKR